MPSTPSSRKSAATEKILDLPLESAEGTYGMTLLEVEDGTAKAEKKKGASIGSSVFNLSNTILGSGTLAMAYAVKTTGIGIFAILLGLVACMADFGIGLLIQSVELIHSKTEVQYPDVGRNAMGTAGRLLASLSVILQQFGACCAYVVIIADVLTPIIQMIITDPYSPLCERWFWQLLIVLLIIFPLCLLKKMDSLKYTSFVALGLIAAYTLAVFVVGSYTAAHPGLRSSFIDGFANETVIRSVCANVVNASVPTSNITTNCSGPGNDVIFFRGSVDFINALPIISFSFLCHMNVFPIYAELAHKSPKRMAKVTHGSMGVCFSVYFVAGVFGYLIFLEATKGDLLKNFLTSGTPIATLMDVLRVGFGVALIFSYPVVIFECRHCVDELCFGHRPYSFKRYLVLNIIIIGLSTIVGILVSSVTTVLGLVGSTCSPLIVFILPAAFYLKLDTSPRFSSKRVISWIMLVFGILLIPLCIAGWVYGLALPNPCS